jgi:hypothetical protein
MNIEGLVEERWNEEETRSSVSPEQDNLELMKTDEERARKEECRDRCKVNG